MSSEEKDATAFLLKGGIAVLVLVVAGLGFLLLNEPDELEEHPLLIEDGEAELTRQPEDPFPDSDDDDLPEPGDDRPRPPRPDEMEFAQSVPGNPLVVILPGENASLGQISVERYDSDGNPTGEPLKRGTQVQIPDPNNPGGKIYFKVP